MCTLILYTCIHTDVHICTLTHFSCALLPKELQSRAQGEMSLREALKELEVWGSAAAFPLVSYQSSAGSALQIVKGFSDLIQEVCMYVLTYILMSVILHLLYRMHVIYKYVHMCVMLKYSKCTLHMYVHVYIGM